MAVALALASAVFLTGCQTGAGTKTTENRIRVTNGAYQGDSTALGGDIRSILMAGGLDVSNPMAPTSDTNRAEIAKTPPPEYNTEAMVAALSETTTRTASAAQTMKPVKANPVAEPAVKPSTALALVSEPKPAPRRQVVMETRVEMEKPQTIELASINMSSSSGDDAFDPIPVPTKEAAPAAVAAPVASVAAAAVPSPPVSDTAASTKTSRVRRF
jgi:hypothetical protein